MKAPTANRRIPISESGFMVGSEGEGVALLPMLPDGQQVQTRCQHNQPRDDGTGAAVVLETKRFPMKSVRAADHREYAERYAGHTQQREKGKERSHICLRVKRESSR